MGGACWGVSKLVASLVGVDNFGGQLLQVGLALVVAAAVYLGVSVLLKSEEMFALRRLLSRMLRRRQSELEPHGREPVDDDSIIE